MSETKNLNLERIMNILKEHKEELRIKYGVKEIGIFKEVISL
jgi:predicted nucleotidyltransferase